MAIPTFFDLIGTNPAGTVLDNLTSGPSAAKAAINSGLNSSVKNQLMQLSNSAGLPAIAGLVEHMPAADIAAVKDLTIQAFVKKQVDPMVANDSAMQQAVDGEIGKFPGTSTIGSLLQLTTPLQNHPLFQSEIVKANLASLLATSPTLGSNLGLEAKFIDRYSARTGSLQDFWNHLSAEPEFKGAVPELQLTLQLAAVTGNNTALMSVVRRQYPLATTADLTKLTTDNWTALLNTPVNGGLIAIPTSIAGTTRDQQVSNYVNSIYTQLKAAFPTLYIAQAVAVQPQLDMGIIRTVLASNPRLDPSKPFPVSVNLSGISDPQAAKTAMAVFRQEINAFPSLDYKSWLVGDGPSNPVRQYVSQIIANSSGFDIQKTSINPQNVPALLQVPASFQTAVAEQLNSLQRLSRLTLDYDQIFALQSEGVHSAFSIARMPQGSFLNKFAPVMGGRATAQLFYSKALSIYAQVAHVFMRVKDGLNGIHFGVFGNVAEGTLQVVQNVVPNLTTLFGDLSSCQCQECRSLDGPSAYFVDLMNFLAMSGQNAAGQTPLDVLKGRRPDLWYLKLNCENTNTELPYIDLVNEILESYVAEGQLDWRTAKNTPSDATTDQLTLNAEYTDPDAYAILKAQVYPPILPFDLPLEVARTYLGSLGSTRAHLMETFRHNNIPSGLAVACEYLKISYGTYSEPLTTRPSELLAFLQIPIKFDYRNGRLKFWGAMSPEQQTKLLALSTDGSYQAAINDLFLTSAALSSLPPGMSLTNNPIPISFNAGQFSFTGMMNWAQQSVLLSISADPSYQEAINSLFQISQQAASGTYSFSLLALPPEVSLSKLGWIPISFTGGQLTFTGTMTGGQQAFLLGLSSNADYTAAIIGLFQMSSQAGLGTFTTTLASLPSGISLSASVNPIPISYVNQKLTIRPPMTPAQRVILLSLSTDEEYQSAVNNLFLMGSPFAAGSFTVPLSSLPAGVALPDQLSPRIAYDAAKQCLTFTGPMSQDQLSTLTTVGTAEAITFQNLRDAGTATPSFAGLPNLPQSIADFLAIRISYDTNSQTLTFQGAMTSAQQAMLMSLSSDQTYQTAIANLAAATASNASGASTSVALSRVPGGVLLPDILSPLVSYDGATSQWRINGAIPRMAQATLVTVSGGDSGLTAALNSLNAITENDAINELDIIVGKTPLPAQQFYGSAGSSLPTQVESFLQATGTVYADLVALLETSFLNPSQSITLKPSTSDQCDLSATTIFSGSQTDVNSFYSKAYRFIRLWKKLSWTIEEVDLALSLVGHGDITPDVILQLAHIKRIQQSLSLAIDQLLSFWSNINTAGRQSLYMRLFQNPAAVKPVDPAFILTYSAGSLPRLPQLSYQFPATGDTITYPPGSNQLLLSGSFSEADELAQISVVLQLANLSAGVTVFYSLPSLVSFPDSTINTISFDTPVVFFTGLMTDAEYEVLKALSIDPNYQLAIDNLYDVAFLKTVAMAAPSAATITEHQNTVLAALRIGATDLAALLAGPMAIPDILNLENLSALYRRATLAQSLGLAISDLLLFITMTGVDPFESPSGTLRFIELAQYVQSSNFSIQQLSYIYANISKPAAGIGPLPGDLFQLLEDLQTGLQQIVQADAFHPDPKGSRLKQALASVLEANLVGQAIGLVNGTQVYSATYSSAVPGLPPNVVAYLSVPLTFNSGRLILAGNPNSPWQTNAAQLAALKSASNDKAYQSAVLSLAKMVNEVAQPTGSPVTYSAPLASLPISLATSQPISLTSNPILISYGPQLTFSGSSTAPNTAMTTAQQAVLLGMSTDTSFQSAINNLFTNSQANGGPVSVSLPSLNLPQGTSLSSNPILISYAAELLTLSGSSTAPNTAMTSAQQTVLLGMSTDGSFQAAINALFTESSKAKGSPVSISLPSLNLPQGTTLNGNPILISYGPLNFSGSLAAPNSAMTSAQQTVLLGLSTDPSFTAAINTLFTESSQASGSPVSVPLPSLNLSAGNSLDANPVPIAYTPGSGNAPGNLQFTGAMTGVQRSVLLDFSQDPNWQAAVNNLYSMSSGTSAPVYSVPLARLPGLLALPGDLPLTQPFPGLLQFVGAMTSAERFTLFRLAKGDPNFAHFDATVANLHAQPRAFIAQTLVPALNGFMTLASADANLIETPALRAQAPSLRAQAKGEFLLKAVLADLQQTASYNLILQTLGAALALDAPTLSLLLQKILPGFAVASEGFSASYYAQQNPTGTPIPPAPTLHRTDSAINFQWGSQTPDASIPGPTFSADWTASVVVPATESYTFHVQADTQSQVQLSVNGTQVPLIPPTPASPNDYFSSPIALTQAQVCTIELRYSYSGPGSGTPVPAEVVLTWKSGSMLENLISPIPGFSASYYSQQNPTGTPIPPAPALQRLDTTINFQGTQTNPTPDPSIPGPAFSADWTGSVVVPFTDSYTFHIQADTQSTVQLLVNGAEVPLIPPTQTSPNDYFSSPIALTRAQICTIELRYSYPVPVSGPPVPAEVVLTWKSPSMPEKPVSPNENTPNKSMMADFMALASVGFSASYFAQQNPTGTPIPPAPTLQRTYKTINFQWGTQTNPTPDVSIPGPAFSADWTGSVVVPVTDSYTFHVQADTLSTVQLFVDGTQVPLIPPTSTSPNDYFSSPVSLTQAQVCTIELRYSYAPPGSPASVPAEVFLKWKSPSMLENLISPISGFSASYYAQQNPTGTPIQPAPALQRTDTAIDFQWGSQTPDASIPGPAFSADWTASVVVPFTDSYTFHVQADTQSTIQLLVNSAQVPLSQPAAASPSDYFSPPLALTQAQFCTIELRYSYSGSGSPTPVPAEVVLTWSSPSMPENPVSPPISVAVQDLLLLYRIALLLTTLNAKADDVAYLQQHGKDFEGKDPNGGSATAPFDLTTLPSQAANYTAPWFNQWKRLNDLFALKASLPTGNVSLFKIFATASPQGVDFYKTLSPVIVAATGWNLDQIQYLFAEFGLQTSDFVNEEPLLLLQKCLALNTNLGVSCVQLFEWATIPPDTAQAQDIKNAVKAKYDDATWSSVGKPLADKLRDKQRDALLAYVLTLPTIPSYITDANGLYEHFLIDVQMAPCMLTSRLVQATAAIQLFVQRCLMNLEEFVSPSAIDAAQWDWMKNYRVWQANRLVFLYPENYLEPSLRDDMTPPFKDLMNALLQNPVTDDNVTQAYADYLNALNEVSQLEIAGMYWQQESPTEPALCATTNADNSNSGTINTLHVFGRTSNSPRKYYYRQFLGSEDTGGPAKYQPTNVYHAPGSDGSGGLNTGSWTPWVPINVNISGDHLIPVVWNRRLFLFWPTFNEGSDPNAQGVTAAGSSTPAPAMKQLQISLNWSEYKQGTWVGPQTTPSTDSLIPQGFNAYLTGQFNPSLFAFDSSQSTELGPGIPEVIVRIDYPTGAPEGNVLQDPNFQHPGESPWQLPPDAMINPDNTLTVLAMGSPNPEYPNATSEPHEASAGQLWQGSISGMSGDENNTLPLQYDQQGIVKIEFLNSSLDEPPLAAFQQPFLSSTSQQNVFSQGVCSGVAPANTAFVHLQAMVSAGAHPNALGTVTFRDASLAQVPPPQLAQFQFSGFPGQISPTGWPNYNVSGSGAPLTPLGTIFDYMNLDGAGTLTFEADSVLLQQTSAYQLLFPQHLLFNPSVSYTTLPFFYSDQQRTYFVSITFQPAFEGGVYPTYTFHGHWHPFVATFLQTFNWRGVPGLLTLANQKLSNDTASSNMFQHTYQPNTWTVADPAGTVTTPYPLENVDFDPSGAYSIYNWELFFHIPLLVATQLSTNQQFEDATTWLEYIFDPTTCSTCPVSQRYWNFLPFARDTEPKQIESLLELLQNSNPDPQQAAQLQSLLTQIQASANDPFNPYAIARLRPMAFMKKSVMAYLDNLIAWGDYLFSQNTRESINEATQVYVLADQILGPRPKIIPSREVTQDLTFNDIEAQLSQQLNAWVQMENAFALSSSGQATPDSSGLAGNASLGTPYFCIPPNSQLLGYWDTVADRLYKIRHCQNIAGQVEQLALFAPPINPLLLVEAEAMGVDLSSVLADINAPSPNYRFTFMVQKALELCSEVRSLGGALLSALEKRDGEALSLLRASQEIAVLQAVLNLKQTQVDEANANYAGLVAAQAVTTYRQSYYQGLINAGLSAFEVGQLAALTEAQIFKTAGQIAQLGAAGASPFPTLIGGAAGISSPVALVMEGGLNVSQGIDYGAKAIDIFADIFSFIATMCSIGGQWDRRSQEWTFQAQSANLELAQIAQQMAAANFRVQIANNDYQNQQLQVTNSQAIQNFLTGKYTNQQLYDWMTSQLSGIYFQCYQMAYGLAKRAELCFRFELGLTTLNYIQFGYWDSLKKGLLAGEGLYADLKSMEVAYLDQNVREYEITKAISLVLLDPISLITLKETGICFISLPEALFDIDYPGHYMRRIKSLSLTIPCVAGPYTSVNGTLTLVTNKIRRDSTAPASSKVYPENPPDDPRFIYDLTAAQSIATSSAQNDSGMFEVNFRDERYLPFEGRGAISSWQLELPLDCNAFDFETIADVIINLKYTARNGGSGLRSAATGAQLPVAPAQTGSPLGGTAFAKQQNLTRFFSLRHEFPTEWYKFLSPAANDSTQSMTMMLSKERFPFQYRGKKIQISSVNVAFKFKDAYPPEAGMSSHTPLGDFMSSGGQLSVSVIPPGSSQPPQVTLQSSPGYLNGTPFCTWKSGPGGLGAWGLQIQPTGLPPSLSNANNYLNPAVVEDVYVVCHYAAA